MKRLQIEDCKNTGIFILSFPTLKVHVMGDVGAFAALIGNISLTDEPFPCRSGHL
jgi:hypothetical protein